MSAELAGVTCDYDVAGAVCDLWAGHIGLHRGGEPVHVLDLVVEQIHPGCESGDECWVRHRQEARQRIVETFQRHLIELGVLR